MCYHRAAKKPFNGKPRGADQWGSLRAWAWGASRGLDCLETDPAVDAKKVGIVGRSGTLGYEAASQMQALGIGVSTSVGIGGDPINGSSFKDILELFEADPETQAVMMIGEIGGPQEAEAAEFVRDHMTKPVVAYVAGLTAPKGRRMGHAGAIISAFGETAVEKVEILKNAGVAIAERPSDLGTTMAAVLNDRELKTGT